MNTFKILNDINSSGKPYVIYKTTKGFDLFTDFSKKIILSNKNIINFLKSISSNKKKIKKTDLYVGFFGYELLNQLIDFVYSIYSVLSLKTGSSLIGKCIIAANTDKAIAKYHA